MTDTPVAGTACTPEPVRAGDLYCGDRIHVDGRFGAGHWTVAFGPHESYPVPGKVQVPRSGRGTHAVYPSEDSTVMVCEYGRTHPAPCGGRHRTSTELN